MIEALLKELQELREFESQIVNRLWQKSTYAIDLEGTSLNNENIQTRVRHLSDILFSQYSGKKPVLIGLMDGAEPFASLLKQEFDQNYVDYDYTTMQASSYGNGLVAGELRIGSLPKVSLTGRHVVILDDVCDTGNTLLSILALLEKQCPASLKSMVLVDKVQDRRDNYTPDFSGFKLDKDAFIIGMGLDYRHTLRNKPCIYTANRAYLPTPEEEEKLARIPVLIEKIIKLHAMAPALNTTGLVENSLFLETSKNQVPMPPAYGLHQ